MSQITPTDGIGPSNGKDAKPTAVRFFLLVILVVTSCLLYLDRFAIGIASEYIREDLGVTQTEMGLIISAFFLTYALCQVPCGWLSDRLGPRRVLTVYILTWSLFTALFGIAHSFVALFALRLLFGASQAGAYPVCTGLIRTWFPLNQRGTACSMITLGGRTGGVLAPILTALLIISFSRSEQVDGLAPNEILKVQPLVERLNKASDPQSPGSPFLSHLKASFPNELQKRIKANETSEVVQKGLVAELGKFVNQADWIGKSEVSGLLLSREANALLKRKTAGEQLSDVERRRMNRLVLEVALPDAIRKLYGRSWRPVLVSYGAFGILMACLFVFVCRDSPAVHPWANAAERRLLEEGQTSIAHVVDAPPPPFPWKAILTSVSLWGSSLMQIFTNIGWIFVVTWLPRYLDKAHGVPIAEQAVMTSIPTVCGAVGMFFGGWWTDRAAERYGLKWGRRLPAMSTRFLAAGGYLMALLLSSSFPPNPENRWLPWAIVFCLGFAVFFCDLGVPSLWAFSQDVGGKFTASVMGWGNMWGNLGAAASPILYDMILGETPGLAQWNYLFAFCAAMFILSGISSLPFDATKPIDTSG